MHGPISPKSYLYILISYSLHILFVTVDNGDKDGISLNAVDAVFHGLYVIIPLMTAELLKVSNHKFYDKICRCQYLLSFPYALERTLEICRDIFSDFGELQFIFNMFCFRCKFGY